MKKCDTIEEFKCWIGQRCVVVFGSYCSPVGSDDYRHAVELGNGLAQRGWAVCSGGYAGIMEAVLKGARAGEGKAVAVLTEYFDFINLKPNEYVQAAMTASGLADRLVTLCEVGDCFVGLKGSTGTLAEIAVALELVNKDPGEVSKLIILDRWWNGVLKIVGNEPRPFHPDQCVRDAVRCVDSVEDVLRLIDGHNFAH